MREIKFRAWDGKDKVMKFFNFFDIHCGIHHPNHWKDNTGLACELTDIERYTNGVMQYTNLKDKNGKEIYEGDIVEHGSCKTVVTFREGQFVGINKGQNGRFIFTKTVEKKFELDAYTHENYPYKTTWKIIGNIYENPELIK